ncbi:glycoside hydrolase family 18 protein [Dyadobacter sp. CY312]|uniref:glycoside hydrolase family 18 protein n=1 Tax=Dyadobacter sp. CY312 TaxID=2907303 RepID=UPI001F197D7D|nr:glycoside hydrolase family 18 protein [Dyadobacter sp. CY312]MCE7041702.1 glycoside hydrolase family 18 protein [Dyadobacter sp. CY312]
MRSPKGLYLSFLFSACSLFLFVSCKKSEEGGATEKSKPVVIGYVGGFHGLLDVDNIEAKKLTHINYAFVDIKNGEAFLTNEKTDSTNFRKLNLLKQQNEDLKILISVGGWAWSENFSDAVLTDSSRKVFAKSSVDIIRKYNLDGVDIDWEYPALAGEEGNVFRPEDKQNYTLMFEEIRKELDVLEKDSGKSKLLTTAVAGWVEFLDATEMGKAQQYLDYVNLMTYDLFQGDTVVNHAPIYTTDVYQTQKSADAAVKAFVKAGVPVEKLVMGIPFYSRKFTVAGKLEKGLGQKQSAQEYFKGYTFIKDSLVNQKGYKAFRDDVAKVPYLVNETTKEIISYEDEESIKERCKYVLENKMGGVMFWEYDSDPKLYLLNAIDQGLK